MTNKANLHARIEPDMKEQDEDKLSNLGISKSMPVYVSELSDAEIDAELEKGYADMKSGKTKPVKSAFTDIRKNYIP
ncbi:MAG: type II toxin-antitoxin system antitoxin, RelB/DinJ family [Clostridiales bacterium]|nr:type II toxin-antitoxin system antitoxin, RelB/DinJ family [Clostridiales bacterium]